MTAIDVLISTDPIGTSPASESLPLALVLAPEGRVVLADDIRGSVRTVARRTSFISLLHDLRPRVAVVVVPPGGPTELLAAVAERRHRATLRLVLLNRPEDVDGRLDALALGFDEALPSSVDPSELAGRIRLLLAQGRGEAPVARPLQIAPNVSLDLVGRRVRRNDREIHLRPKEFALLALLAAEPGRVFSRDELIDRVWGPRYRGGARTVDVHVRWLRAKIEVDPARPAHVITVRGTGYRLDPPER